MVQSPSSVIRIAALELLLCLFGLCAAAVALVSLPTEKDAVGKQGGCGSHRSPRLASRNGIRITFGQPGADWVYAITRSKRRPSGTSTGRSALLSILF